MFSSDPWSQGWGHGLVLGMPQHFHLWMHVIYQTKLHRSKEDCVNRFVHWLDGCLAWVQGSPECGATAGELSAPC